MSPATSSTMGPLPRRRSDVRGRGSPARGPIPVFGLVLGVVYEGERRAASLAELTRHQRNPRAAAERNGHDDQEAGGTSSMVPEVPFCAPRLWLRPVVRRWPSE